MVANTISDSGLVPMHITLHGWGLRAGIFQKQRILLAFASHIGSGYLYDKQRLTISAAQNLR
jgi:hypothetical protein